MSLYARKNNNYGVNTNVELDPNAISQSTVENKIYINTSDEPVIRSSQGEECPTVLANPIEIVISELEAKLLQIYTEILLSQNKTLLSNILSSKNIILSKTDLESVIFIKTSAKCQIVLEDSDGNGCCAKINPLCKIDMIKIIHENLTEVDFKYIYNSDYCLFRDKYHISLTYCLK
jgi:hypothetical protein